MLLVMSTHLSVYYMFADGVVWVVAVGCCYPLFLGIMKVLGKVTALLVAPLLAAGLFFLFARPALRRANDLSLDYEVVGQ